jgi:polyhydroxyalkanoate synthesis regulator protein
VRQNLQLFDRAMKMFSPFAYTQTPGDEPQAPAEPAPAAAGSDEALNELKAQVAAMQKQIEKLVSKS